MLEPLGARWRHTLGVVERAFEVASVLAEDDADVVVAAAYVHDVGYAPELSETGFHPLDGARFARGSGHGRLAGLVAYHCSSEAEAIERGLRDELAEFEDERSGVSRALTYCDLTTDAEGRRVDPAERLRGIRERYGPETPEARALERSATGLLDNVRMVEAMLRARVSVVEPDGPGQWR
ncbi:MAG: HD domain-containing protein [Trebonia sp.]